MAIGTPTLLASGSSTTNNTTCTTSGSAGTAPSGCLIVVFSYHRNASALTATVADSASLTWTNLDFQVGGAGGCSLSYAQAPSGVSAGWTATTTWSASGTRKFTSAYYITGLASSSVEDTPFRPTGVSGSTGNSSITAAAASAQADEIFICMTRHNAATGSVTGTADTNFTELDDTITGASTFLQSYSQYRIVSATSTPTVVSNFTDTTTNWATGLVAFKMAAASNITLTPSVATATADGIVPGLLVSLAPLVAASTAMAPVPGVLISIAPTVATATAAGIIPVIQSGLILTPPVAAATADGVTPALKVALAPTIAAATAAAITPALLTSLAPTVSAATAAALVPGLRASVAPTVAAATASALAPVLRAALAPTVASATAAALVPGLKASLAPLVAAASATAIPPALAVALAPTIASAIADAVTPVISAQAPVALLTVHLATHPTALSTTVHANLIRIIPTPDVLDLVVAPDGEHLVISPVDSLYVQPSASLVCVLGYSNQNLGSTNIATLESEIGRSFHGLRQNQQYTTTGLTGASGAIAEYDAGRTLSYRSIQFNTAPGGWAAAANGDFDTQLTTFCTNVINAARWTTENPFWVCLHHEATTSGGVFGTAGYSAADYKAMWAHCVPVMLATGAPIAFAYIGWDRMFVGLNGVGPPTAGEGIDDLDPGTAYYSRIGSDPYNTILSPGTLRYGTDAAVLLGPIVAAARSRHMDWMMGEMGCEDGSTQADHDNKKAWLDSLHAYVVALGAYGPGVCRAMLTTHESASSYQWDSSSTALTAGVSIGGDNYFS